MRRFRVLCLGAASCVLVAGAVYGRQDEKNVPAREYYENIEIFTGDGVSAAMLDRLMLEISTDLGVPCGHCHDEAALASVDLPTVKLERRARIPEMWNVVMRINQDHFPGQGAPVRCWTCHRGAPVPERAPPGENASSAGRAANPFAAPHRMVRKVASRVYSNLQVLGDWSAGSIEPTMEFIATSIDAFCSDCHVGSDPASDQKARKQKARAMLQMVDSVGSSLFEGEETPTCWTCHRGERKPAFERPSEEGAKP